MRGLSHVSSPAGGAWDGDAATKGVCMPFLEEVPRSFHVTLLCSSQWTQPVRGAGNVFLGGWPRGCSASRRAGGVGVGVKMAVPAVL